MGRWGDWDAIEAAQARAAEQDAQARARKSHLRVVTPEDVTPEPVATPEPSRAIVRASPTAPMTRDEITAELLAGERGRVGFVEGIRLYARVMVQTLDRARNREEKPPWER